MAAGIGQVFEGMIMEKNFSLLRPFDLEAAKRGEAIVWGHETKCRFVGVSDHEKTARNIVEHESGLSYVCDRELAMAPLAWVEGKPVYKGDVLWQNLVKRVVIGASQSGSHIETDTAIIDPQYLTWTPPKVKREVKLLAYFGDKQLFWLCESVKPARPAVRVPSEDKTITVEE